MKVIATEKIEDCFDGSRVYRYQFDQPWSAPSILQLQQVGSLQFFPDFPRPFFRLHTDAGVQITGVGDEDSCRVVFPNLNQAQLKQELEAWFLTDNKTKLKEA